MYTYIYIYVPTDSVSPEKRTTRCSLIYKTSAAQVRISAATRERSSLNKEKTHTRATAS